MPEAEVEENDDYILPACAFGAPEGKEFDKWSVTVGGASPIDKMPGDPVKVTDNVTVKAGSPVEVPLSSWSKDDQRDPSRFSVWTSWWGESPMRKDMVIDPHSREVTLNCLAVWQAVARTCLPSWATFDAVDRKSVV